jgi:hypothetical protein
MRFVPVTSLLVPFYKDQVTKITSHFHPNRRSQKHLSAMIIKIEEEDEKA